MVVDVVVWVVLGGAVKPAPGELLPKIGLKPWSGGLLSGAVIVEGVEAVVATAKMGLNPEASRGLE